MPQVTENGRAEPWRSLNDLAGTPEYKAAAAREFPGVKASEYSETSRRRFMQLMGASFALASAAGCWKEDKIVPYVKGQDGVVPGVPRAFATIFEIGGIGRPLVVNSFDGRPVKVEGNELHSQSLGATEVFCYAQTLELYDPERSTGVKKLDGGKQADATWEEYTAFAKGLFEGVRAKQGARFAVLSEAVGSPALAAQKAAFHAALPQARWFEYEPVSYDNDRAATTLVFGQTLRTHYSLVKADVIATFDFDLLHAHPTSLRLSREFAAGRKPAAGEHEAPKAAEGADKKHGAVHTMNRLWSVESNFSATGALADHRLPLQSAKIVDALSALALELAKDGNTAGTPAGKVLAALKAPKLDAAEEKFIKVLASDLLRAAKAGAGHALVAVGPGQTLQALALGHLINTALGAVGSAITYTADPDPSRSSYNQQLKTLSDLLEKGELDALVIMGGNPAYNTPADVKFAERLSKVPATIHLGLYNDETARLCKWHLPKAHAFEAWGDALAWDGTYSVAQPLILPMYSGKSALELAAEIVSDKPVKALDLVRASFKKLAGSGDVEAAWRKCVHDGLQENSAAAAVKPDVVLPALNIPARAEGAGLELNFAADPKIYDGRFANNGWLQEVPEHMTKLTWDNALLVAEETARKHGLEQDTLARVTAGGRTLDAAVYIMPGHAKDSLTLTLGYGRTHAGSVGGNVLERIPAPGFNAYLLRSIDAPDLAVQGVSVAPTGVKYPLASTQDHWQMDTGGQKEIQARVNRLAREGSLDEYNHHPDFAQHVVHIPPLEQLFKEWSHDGNKWALAIDLNACTGCTACVVACQSENNIPIVGKEQIFNGREMLWLRIDRYFKGDVANPQVVQQPVTCQQCENAPCEQVCPAAATVHTNEGLNDMVYNRCIGTRYCSNNCPYKVRRFNYFDWNKKSRESVSDAPRMVFNPDVTVRMRGVMEKCTFCVQRIQRVKIAAKNAGQRDEKRILIKDGAIKTACQQACPAGAIVFGDLNDAESKVSKLHADARAYKMLEELNVRPRVAYLARLRNPHPELAEVKKNEQPNGHHG